MSSPAVQYPALERGLWFKATAVALSVAAIDLARVLAHSLNRFESPGYALATFGALAVVAFVAWLVAWFIVLRPAARWARLDTGTVCGSAAVAAVAAFALFEQVRPSCTPEGFLAAGMVAVVALLVGVGLYAIAARHPEASRRLGVAAPYAVLFGVDLLWVQESWMGGVHMIGSPVMLLVAALASWAFYAWAARASAVRVFPGIAALVTALALVLAFGTGRVAPASPDAQVRGNLRHVILISVDTLRRDVLSCYGSTTVQTPAVDALAADGCRFHNAVSASSWTLPAFASIFSGLPPSVHGVVRSVSKLPDGVATLAQRFQEAGYWTKALVTNPILAPHRNFSRGFDDYTFSSSEYEIRSVGERILKRFRPDELPRAASTTRLTDAAIQWVRANRASPFLLWVHYLDPHLPYAPPQKYVEATATHELLGNAFHSESGNRPTMDTFGDPAQRAWVRSLYDAEVRYVDDEVGRLLSALKEAGIYEDALVVFVSDHGEEFWEHDGFEHGHTLYNEVMLVPLIVKPPHYEGGREVKTFVATQHLARTMLDLAGLPPLDSTFTVSLAPHLEGQEAPAGAIFGSGLLFNTDRESVLFGGWKLIRSKITGRIEFFDLGADPGERQSRALTGGERLERALDLIDYHWIESEQYQRDAGIESQEIHIDPETIERLKALGYL